MDPASNGVETEYDHYFTQVKGSVRGYINDLPTFVKWKDKIMA